MRHYATAVERIAFEYVDAHISVIPLLTDGSKGPALPIGQPQVYAQRLPTPEELHAWFGDPLRVYGIALKCGGISLGLEAFVVDMQQLLSPLLSLLPVALRNKLSIVETPGGWHLIYRCRRYSGNHKIASWEAASSLSQKANGHREATGFKSIGKGVRIESRGEGGFIVAVGSPCSVDASGLPYCHAFGPRPPHFQHITEEERALLWNAARSFDCRGPSERRESARVQAALRQLKRPISKEQIHYE